MKSLILASAILLASTAATASETVKLYCTLTMNNEFETAEIIYVGGGRPNHQIYYKNGASLNVKQDGAPYYFQLWKNDGNLMAVIETNTTEIAIYAYSGDDKYEATCEYALSNPTP